MPGHQPWQDGDIHMNINITGHTLYVYLQKTYGHQTRKGRKRRKA